MSVCSRVGPIWPLPMMHWASPYRELNPLTCSMCSTWTALSRDTLSLDLARVGKKAVHILLECFLVPKYYIYMCFYAAMLISSVLFWVYLFSKPFLKIKRIPSNETGLLMLFCNLMTYFMRLRETFHKKYQKINFKCPFFTHGNFYCNNNIINDINDTTIDIINDMLYTNWY